MATVWKSRKLNDRRRWRYTRRALIAVASVVLAYATIAPLGFSYIITHVMRQTVPAANLGAAHENISFTTSDGLELQGWYVPSKNGAAVIAFPGRSGPRAHTRMLARHGYGVCSSTVAARARARRQQPVRLGRRQGHPGRGRVPEDPS